MSSYDFSATSPGGFISPTRSTVSSLLHSAKDAIRLPQLFVEAPAKTLMFVILYKYSQQRSKTIFKKGLVAGCEEQVLLHDEVHQEGRNEEEVRDGARPSNDVSLQIR